MPEAALALGSNVGDAPAQIARAIEALGARMRVVAVSPVYRTAPMYELEQPEFVNGAAIVETDRSPRDLLRLLKEIEVQLGRTRRARYGPREIDLDLIAYGVLAYEYVGVSGRNLQIPHPRTPERRFVLRPLADLRPGLVLPGLGRVDELLARTSHQGEDVRPLGGV